MCSWRTDATQLTAKRSRIGAYTTDSSKPSNMADLLGIMQPTISSSSMDISVQRDGRSGGIPPAERTSQNNQGGIIPNIDYFSFEYNVFKLRLVKRTIITIPQEQFPLTTNLQNKLSYRLLNNWCLSAILRTFTSFSSSTAATIKVKTNALMAAQFPYMRIGKLRMRISNFIPVINSINPTGQTTLNTINPAPWMCIAMDTKGAYRSVGLGPQSNRTDQWLDMISQNSCLIPGQNWCSQWSHVETLQMGQVWNYEQSYPIDNERWFVNPISQDATYVSSSTPTTFFYYPSNIYSSDSWFLPYYPSNDTKTNYRPAENLSPIAVYIPHIGGLDQADNSPQISGSATLEVSQTFYFASYMEPFADWDKGSINENMNKVQLQYSVFATKTGVTFNNPIGNL